MDPFVLAQINLGLQIAILVLLSVSTVLKKMRRRLAHGVLMSVATFLNLASFLIIMLPSLLRMEILRTNPYNIISIVTIAHASLGMITIIFSVWLVGSWHFKSSVQNCARRKKMMRTTLILWSTVLLLGFVLYYYLYGFYW
ncbi:MAG TPA: hypothetical protein VMT01_02835 [Candidatus Acidoferrum sp.]|jgi:uncharacterized membrane protein YozB (DUF420 family)|nr:hypothetical protein [Candidatus Acidoferrum sp.]